MTVQTRDDVRQAVVEAAARLLREQGVRAVTTRGVAQAAGVQAPTIYRLFGDKDGLVDAVAEHVKQTYVAAKADAPESGDPVADLRAAWQRHIDFGLANPELSALLGTPGRQTPSPATTAGIEVLQARVHRLAEAGLLRVDERRAVLMIHAAGTGAVLTQLTAPPGTRDDGLPDAVLEATLAAILTTAPSAGRADDPTTAAITFATKIQHLEALTDAERTLMHEWVDRSVTAARDS